MSQIRSHRFKTFALIAQVGVCAVAALALVASALVASLRSPGIDQVGGISLVYEIKNPDGVVLGNGNLALEVAEVLKRRVDPDGMKNLIWHPEGDSRLEIQVPLPPEAKRNAEDQAKLRAALAAAADELETTNVSPEAVIAAIESPDPASASVLTRLAGDSKVRRKMFADLKDLWNQMQQARAAGDARTFSRLQLEYDGKIPPKSETGSRPHTVIEDTNVSREDLDDALATTSQGGTPDESTAAANIERGGALDKLKISFGDFPSRLQAIDAYALASGNLVASRISIDDVSDLKRMLKGAGVLEFHILAAGVMPEAEYRKYVIMLSSDGPRVHPGDEARWFEVTHPETNHMGPTAAYRKRQYVLGYIVSDHGGKPRSLDAHSEKPWYLADAFKGRDLSGMKVVEFKFDAQGAEYFGSLTEANIHKPLAIVLDNKVISAPSISSKITVSGEISGGGNGFTSEEQDYLANTLRGGSLPAVLSDEPISERVVPPRSAGMRALLRVWRWALLLVVAVWLFFSIGMLMSFKSKVRESLIPG